jgi:hypothetical protein
LNAFLLRGDHPLQFLDLLIEQLNGPHRFQSPLSQALIASSHRLLLLSSLLQFVILAHVTTLADCRSSRQPHSPSE